MFWNYRMNELKQVDDLKYELDVPGFNKDTLKIELSNNRLTIKGKSNDREIDAVYSVGQKVKDVKAKVKDGILTIEVVMDEKLKPRQIAIE